MGHQIIGQVFGSKIVQAEKLMHGKTSIIKSNKIGILKNLPIRFEATRYHSLIIDKKTLSKELEITAQTEDGIIMGVKHKHHQLSLLRPHLLLKVELKNRIFHYQKLYPALVFQKQLYFH